MSSRSVGHTFGVPSVSAIGDAGRGEPEPGPTLYLKVDDIDDYYGALLANGFTPSTEPRKQHSGTREFLINDPDGNDLAFLGK